MNQDILQIVLHQRDAAAVKRYHVKRTLRQQTVGEHTFGVLMLLRMVLPDDYDPDKTAVLLVATMHHDLPELVTGDIPAPVKRRFPALNSLLDQIECSADNLYFDFPLTAEEKVMLKWADTMELVLWCMEERELGNRNMDRTISRALGYIGELKLPWQQAVVLTNRIVDYCATSGIVVMVGNELEHNT